MGFLEDVGRSGLGEKAIKLRGALENIRAGRRAEETHEVSMETADINLQAAKNKLAVQEVETKRRTTSVNLLTTPMYMAMSPDGQERVKNDMLSRGIIDTEGVGTIGGGEDYLKGQVESVAGYKAIMGGEVDYKKQQYLQADTAVKEMERDAQEKGKDLKTDKKYGIAIQNRDRLRSVYTKSQAAYGGHLLDLEKVKVTAEEARKTATAKATAEGKGTTFTKIEGAAFGKWVDGKTLTEREQVIVNRRMTDPLFAQATKLVMDDLKLSFKSAPERAEAIFELFTEMKEARGDVTTTGKELTDEIAQGFLDEANNDPREAEKLARDAGYVF